MKWLAEGHMVNITPVSQGSVLAWREVQVWLRCWPFLKLMWDHEIQCNVHSLEFLSDLWAMWWPCCHCYYQWHTLHTSEYRHMQSERYNFGPLIVHLSDFCCSKSVSKAADIVRRKLFDCSTFNLLTSLNMNTHTHTPHTVVLAPLWGLPVWQMDKAQFAPLSHTQTLGIHSRVMSVCVLEWSFICPFLLENVREGLSSEQCEHAEWAELPVEDRWAYEPQTVKIRDMFKRRPSAAGLYHVWPGLGDLGTSWHTYSSTLEHHLWNMKIGWQTHWK